MQWNLQFSRFLPRAKGLRITTVKVFTIGFTKKSARHFFSVLRRVGVSRVIDVRLNNASQLAGFAKKQDLEFFLRELVQIEYEHCTDLAPTQDMLDRFKKQHGEWRDYERAFIELMARRKIEQMVSPDLLENACLLCSEHLPHRCHRRLVVEYLNNVWGGRLHIEHLT